jgi:hypothetical protein
MKTQLDKYEIELINGIAGNDRNKKPALRHIARGCAMTEIRFATRDWCG